VAAMNLNGQGIEAPWLRDQVYQGQKAWFESTLFLFFISDQHKSRSSL
jgi:hypothetical protein